MMERIQSPCLELNFDIGHTYCVSVGLVDGDVDCIRSDLNA